MSKREQYCQEIEKLLEIRYATGTQAYKRDVRITVTGIVVHSIGVAQPSVDVMHSRMNAEGDRWAVHALMNNKRIVLTLPWNTRPWACGSGRIGSYNVNRFQFEICEPAGHTYSGGQMIGYDAAKNAAWFGEMYDLLVKFLVFLCVKFGLTADKICDHAEAYKAGYGSNHSDVGQWFPKHGKSMSGLRTDVQKILNEKEAPVVAENKTPDNTPAAWAEDAVDWAVKNTILVGDDKGNLQLRAPLTREQFCVMLYRYHAKNNG